MIFTCDYCKEMKEIIAFIPAGRMKFPRGMNARRPCCKDCYLTKDKTIDGKPAEKHDAGS